MRVRANTLHTRQAWIFLGSIILFFTFINFCRRLWAASTRRPRQISTPSTPTSEPEKKDIEHTGPVNNSSGSQRPSPLSRVITSISSAFRIVTFRWSLFVGPYNLGSLGELTFITLYIAANFIWLFTGRESLNVPPCVATESLIAMGLTINYWKSRSGMIGTAQIPLVVALGTKNNIISCTSSFPWVSVVVHTL